MNTQDELVRLAEETFPSSLKPEEAEEGKTFLCQFSPGGALYLSRLFNSARRSGITFRQVMDRCQKTWEELWKHEKDRRGDPDNPENNSGMKNACALLEIYHGLGLNPKML